MKTSIKKQPSLASVRPGLRRGFIKPRGKARLRTEAGLSCSPRDRLYSLQGHSNTTIWSIVAHQCVKFISVLIGPPDKNLLS